jgi:DNA-nicking Smr family endonuclease
MGNLFSSTDEVENSPLSNSSGWLSQSGIPTGAALLRDEAHQLKLRAKEAAQQSQSEYCSGFKAEAKALSIKKANLYIQMNEKNQQAAELIFQHFNRNRSNNVIDLHGLYVAEALKYLKNKLDECREGKILQLTVITGIGNNSPNRIAKIKPEVEKFVHQNCLKVTSYGGHVIIDLSTYNQNKTTPSQNADECVIL